MSFIKLVLKEMDDWKATPCSKVEVFHYSLKVIYIISDDIFHDRCEPTCFNGSPSQAAPLVLNMSV